ncbi:MAG: hypothetical protein ACOX3Q_11995 [Clostridia bacterium]
MIVVKRNRKYTADIANPLLATFVSIRKDCLFSSVLFEARLTAYIPATYMITPIMPLRNAVK